METLKHTFLEDPTYVYLFLLFAELVLAAVWYERRSRKWQLVLAVPPIVAGVVFLVAALVVTDRERITRISEEIAIDCGHRSTSAADKYLDDRFGGYWVVKAAALAAGKAAMEEYQISGVTITRNDIEVDGEEATQHATTLVTLGEGKDKGRIPLSWRLRWAKRNGEWRIVEVDYPKEAAGL